MGRGALVLATFVTAAAAAATGLAATPAGIVAKLNAQRVANGIPGGIALDGASTLGCQHHLRYEELNGIGYTHDETKGRPGYTKDGSLAGLTGVQADTGGWDGGDPYENLPLHLAYLLEPRLGKIGAADDGRRTCVTVSLGFTRQFAVDAIYVYPGSGRHGVPTAQVVRNETPFAPGDLVGLPQGTTTGPYLYVFAVGPGFGPVRLLHAHLTGQHGPVAIRKVDTVSHPELSAYSPSGVSFLIPESPLAAGTTYHASVMLKMADGKTMSKAWTFVTG